jgi:DNA damage-binding protein 1
MIATDSGLRIGSIDNVQKLQFRTIKLGELVRRVVETDLVFATISMRLQVDKITGNESQLSFVRLFDKISFKETDQYELETNEACQSLCLHTTADGEQRVVVGTSHQSAEVDQNRRGRIIIFGVNEADKSLWLEAQIEVPGAVYAAASLPRGYLAAGVNSYLRLYNCTGEQIEQTAEFRSNTTVISVSSRDYQIIVGDLMRSITVLEMESGASDAPAELIEVARDYAPLWTTATSFFGAHAYVAGELEGNLVLYAKSDSPLEENELRLDRTGTFKYGEYINKIVPGYIIPPDEEAIVHPRCIFCTVDGSIGIIGEIHADQVNFLLDLQAAISESIDSVGGLSHVRWRAFRAGTIRKQGPERFVDGDLLESYLDMDPEAQAAVSKQMNMTIGEIERLIESLARLH